MGPYADALPAHLDGSHSTGYDEQQVHEADPGHNGMPEQAMLAEVGAEPMLSQLSQADHDVALGSQPAGPDDQQEEMWWDADDNATVVASQDAACSEAGPMTDPVASIAELPHQHPVCDVSMSLQQQIPHAQASGTDPSVHVSVTDGSQQQPTSRPVSAATPQRQHEQQQPQQAVPVSGEQVPGGGVSFDVRRMDLFQQQDTCDAFASFWRSTGGAQHGQPDASTSTNPSAQGQAAGIALGGKDTVSTDVPVR